MMKKLGYVTFMLLQLFTLDLLAQRQVEQIDPEKEEEQKRAASTSRVRPEWMERVSFGGNIGGTIGTNEGFFTAQLCFIALMIMLWLAQVLRITIGSNSFCYQTIQNSP